ncbi:TerC family protein, partial [Vibrio parahaemolyticus]|uniref:TerC family protein n=1 Tax=Vibrio parahaemolyticus TaxID=670 RepID=UPI001AC44A93|nr:hypothetical protein [Vibrio parahaemolyticus]
MSSGLSSRPTTPWCWHKLPQPWRARALFYGIAGAYVLRGLALLFAAILIAFWWVQALGAVY